MKHQTTIIGATLAAFALTLAHAPAISAAPSNHIAIQGLLRSQGGGPVTDGLYVLELALHDSEKGGKNLWQGLPVKVPVTGGAFFHTVGVKKALPAGLWSSGGPVWLGVVIDGNKELPRVALVPVPRAHHAATAGGLACSGCVDGVSLAPGSVGAKHVAFTYAGAKTEGRAGHVCPGSGLHRLRRRGRDEL